MDVFLLELTSENKTLTGPTPNLHSHLEPDEVCT